MTYLYGLLKYGYETNNIGDEIQSLAASRFLPQIDLYLDRDELNSVRSDRKIKMILNGWFMRKPENWPPSPSIEPLFVSFHITDAAAERLTSPESIAYLKQHQPIGCRDYFTRDLLKDHGVDAYFSGCLTMTLNRDSSIPRSDEILFVDVDSDVMEHIPAQVMARASLINHHSHRYSDSIMTIGNFLSSKVTFLYDFLRLIRFNKFLKSVREVADNNEARFMKAEALLKRYASAKLVVTSRIHCALPCLAFGTPVIFVNKNLEDTRFGGIIDHMTRYTPQEFKEKCSQIDWENPPSNPGDISAIREGLIKSCRNFLRP